VRACVRACVFESFVGCVALGAGAGAGAFVNSCGEAAGPRRRVVPVLGRWAVGDGLGYLGGSWKAEFGLLV
jgi:hypothetical protein